MFYTYVLEKKYTYVLFVYLLRSSLILLEALKGTNAADTLVMKDFSSRFRLFFGTKIVICDAAINAFLRVEGSLGCAFLRCMQMARLELHP